MDESLLPGCYGSPACFRAHHIHCGKCPHLNECFVATKARSERMRAKGKVWFVVVDMDTAPRMVTAP
jgi:hypothetical protein